MKTLLALAVIATVLGSGLAIKCFVCNSHTHKDCAKLPENINSTYMKDCGNREGGDAYNICRKLDMHLDMDFGKKHPAENRIHRDCGVERAGELEEKANDGCYYKSGYNTRTWVCSCNQDGCNSASVPSVAALLLLPLAALVAVLRGAY